MSNMWQSMGISSEILALAEQAESDIALQFSHIDEISQINSLKVLCAFRKNRVSTEHLGSTTGYGYDDAGRDTLDRIYAQVFECEDALVRQQIVSGTHALSTALFGVLRPGDTLVSITGKPYDTLEEVIGIKGEGNGSLKDFGVSYRQLDLLNGKVDVDRLQEVLDESVKVVFLQRSKGYDWRPSISISEMKTIFESVRKYVPNAIIMVDNCYGEFVEEHEPSAVGADLIIGSLIKNPGGGLAQSGGYIAGRADLIEQISYRLTTVGTGKEVGASLGQNRLMYQGLFLAPHVVSQAMKTAMFCSRLFERMGYEVCPASDEYRTDIIQIVRFGKEADVIRFCEGIQFGSPIDSYVAPVPWDMPGYDSQVIMAAGAFVQGASIELSADAPIRPPYQAYMQGGLTYETGKYGILMAAQKILEGKKS